MINEKRAREYCKEDISKIENYEQAVNDTTQVWHCHHMTETWWNCSKKDLIDNECYYNRKACELIFLTPAEHNRLHKKGKHHTEETRRKIGEANKGQPLSEETRIKLSEANKGKHLSEETRRKISEANKNISDETRRKIGEAHKGKHHTEETRRKIGEANKGKHHSEEARKKIGEARKGKPASNKGKTTSVFGAAYKEHYGITSCDNFKLYYKEHSYYKRHGHFSWDVN